MREPTVAHRWVGAPVGRRTGRSADRCPAGDQPVGRPVSPPVSGSPLSSCSIVRMRADVCDAHLENLLPPHLTGFYEWHNPPTVSQVSHYEKVYRGLARAPYDGRLETNQRILECARAYLRKIVTTHVRPYEFEVLRNEIVPPGKYAGRYDVVFLRAMSAIIFHRNRALGRVHYQLQALVGKRGAERNRLLERAQKEREDAIARLARRTAALACSNVVAAARKARETAAIAVLAPLLLAWARRRVGVRAAAKAAAVAVLAPLLLSRAHRRRARAAALQAAIAFNRTNAKRREREARERAG